MASAGDDSSSRNHNDGRHNAPRRRTTTIQLPSRHGNLVEAPSVSYASFLSGLTAGVVSAGLFNPFDRALYLSVKDEVPFLTKSNFANPYSGFFQSVGHRAASGGLYYPLEQFFINYMSHPPELLLTEGKTNFALHNFMAGTAAGAANALIVNPISAVKYKTWGRDVPRSFLNEATDMLRKGGIRPLFNGMIPTLLRDVVFGGCYTFIRFELQYRFQLSNSDYQWAANFVAASMATIVSGPFNLARNVQYATRSRNIADSVTAVLINFGTEVLDRPTALEKCKHVQNRLRIGWGTARVAIGMSFGHFVYDKLSGIYYYYEQQTNYATTRRRS